MTELTRLRLEVRLTRFVLIVAAVAFLAGAVIRQPDVDTLSLRRLELVDDDGAVAGSLGVQDGQLVLKLTNHGEVCFLRRSKNIISDHGNVTSIGGHRVPVTDGKATSMSIVGPGLVTTRRDGTVWVSSQQ